MSRRPAGSPALQDLYLTHNYFGRRTRQALKWHEATDWSDEDEEETVAGSDGMVQAALRTFPSLR